MSTRPELIAGELLVGRYRLVRVLGEGGMGIVWLACDEKSGDDVAIKLIKSANHTASAHRRLLREARAASAVRHPNVVRLRDVLELDAGAPALVMDFLRGAPLSVLLAKRGRLSIEETAQIMLPAVSAVAALHALGIVHRDLKPDNVFLSTPSDGSAPIVTVLDFGIAKLTATDGHLAQSTDVTATGAILGTPHYMSREQLFGENAIDHRTDVWSLGLILYLCVSGRLPTQADNIGQILKIVVEHAILPVRDVVPAVPDDVARLIDSMLHSAREDRLSDLSEVLGVLGRHAVVELPPFAPSTVPIGGVRSAASSEQQIVGATDGVDVSAKTVAVPGLQTRSGSGRRRGTWARPVAMSLVAASALGLGGMTLFRAGFPSAPKAAALQAPSSTPLLDKDSVLACPQLEASGVEEPQGWLGAAAAEIVCRRALWMLGGKPARVVWPAALLDLPSDSSDSFPSDPYGAPGARDRALEAAKRRATVYLDGIVTREGDGFSTRVTLRTSAEHELATGKGHGRLLAVAVKAAVTELEQTEALPHARELDPDVGRWMFTRSADVRMAYDDAIFGWVPLADACTYLETKRDRLARRGAVLSDMCPSLKATPGSPRTPTLDEQWPGEFLEAIDNSSEQANSPEEISSASRVVDSLVRDGDTAWARNAIAVARAALLLRSGDTQGAVGAYKAAIAAIPFDGDVWASSIALGAGPTRLAAATAFSAWCPSYGLAWEQRSSPASDDASIVWARRARITESLKEDFGIELARRLLATGKLEEVRTLAATYTDDTEGHRVAHRYLLARLDAADGSFGEAFVRVRGALDAITSIVGDDNPAARNGAIYETVLLGQILGRSTDWADSAAQRLVVSVSDPSTLRYDRATLAALVCLHASKPVAILCAQHLERVTAGVPLEWTYGGKALFAGVKRYIAGDTRGAVAAWRPLLGSSDERRMLRFVPVEIFDAAGETDIAELIDRETAQLAWFHGIGSSVPHMAKRALARGDKPRARELAQQVIDAWSVADVSVPAVEEMRNVLQRAR